MAIKKEKIVLIGVNHAGTTAVKAILRNRPNDTEVVAYDRNDNISFLGCGIALWVGQEFSDPKGLFYANAQTLTDMGAQVHMGHEMVDINPEQKIVVIKDVKTNKIMTETYDKLVLGIGSRPVSAPGGKEIPGLYYLQDGKRTEDLLSEYKLTEGIHFSKFYQNAQDIIAQAKTNVKNVVVIGAGYIGIELVEAFVKIKKNVTLIDFENRVMPRYYDPEFTVDLEKDMVKDGVNLRLGETVKEFISKDNKVTHVVTNKGTVEADLVIMAVGFLPNTEILKNSDGTTKLELDPRGAIVVNKFFQTSDPSIYAIGDCIAIYSNAWEKSVNVALATNAVRSGLVAGLNIATGNKVPFPGIQGTNAISVFGWTFSSTGLSEISAKMVFGENNVEASFLEDTVYPPFMAKNHTVKFKIIWDKKTRRIIGAEVGSTHDHSEIMFMFSLAIMKKVTIDELPLVDMYFLPHFNKPYNYVTATALSALGLLKPEDIVYPDPYNKKK